MLNWLIVSQAAALKSLFMKINDQLVRVRCSYSRESEKAFGVFVNNPAPGSWHTLVWLSKKCVFFEPDVSLRFRYEGHVVGPAWYLIKKGLYFTPEEKDNEIIKNIFPRLTQDEKQRVIDFCLNNTAVVKEHGFDEYGVHLVLVKNV